MRECGSVLSFYMNLNQQQARNSGIQSSSGLKETRSEKLRFILGHPLARCSIRGQFWLIPERLLLFYCNDLSLFSVLCPLSLSLSRVPSLLLYDLSLSLSRPFLYPGPFLCPAFALGLDPGNAAAGRRSRSSNGSRMEAFRRPEFAQLT